MKVSNLVADWVASVNPRVYALCGAGAMHLNDAICHHPKLQVIACHHEQAATFAAEADARVSGKPGIVHVTAGPGASNTITGLACAYVDSIPLICIAGQVTRDTLRPFGMRQRGMNELDMLELVAPVTKVADVLNLNFISHPARNAMARATERARSRTVPPSFPLLTIHWPSGARPVIMPMWWDHTTITPMPAGFLQMMQFG